MGALNSFELSLLQSLVACVICVRTQEYMVGVNAERVIALVTAYKVGVIQYFWDVVQERLDYTVRGSPLAVEPCSAVQKLRGPATAPRIFFRGPYPATVLIYLIFKVEVAQKSRFFLFVFRHTYIVGYPRQPYNEKLNLGTFVQVKI